MKWTTQTLLYLLHQANLGISSQNSFIYFTSHGKNYESIDYIDKKFTRDIFSSGEQCLLILNSSAKTSFFTCTRKNL